MSANIFMIDENSTLNGACASCVADNISTVSGSPRLKLDRAHFMASSGSTVRIGVESENLSAPIEWTSDNEAVATVDSEGRVTALSHGDAVITAVSDSALAFCLVSVDYEGQNPILPPTWGLYICDPEPYVIDGRMYIFGSKDRPMAIESDGSRGYCSTEYNVIYSDDMKNWIDVGVTLTLDDIPPKYRGGNRLWGPSCLFKARETGRDKDKYYLIANTNSYTAGMVLLEADSPTGPFLDPRPMTMDGRVIGNLDPGVLADDDGKVYFAYQHDGYRFSVCQLDPDDFSRLLSETSVDVTDVFKNGNPNEWPDEGQSLKKRRNTYYYLNILNWLPSNERRIPVKMAYLMSESPLGPWRYGGVIVDTYNYLDSSNIQGSFAEFNGQSYVCYHMPTPDSSSSRYCWIDRITFNDDGTINRIEPTSSGPKGSFFVGETIMASSGVHFSGGRGDKRIVQRYKGDLKQWWKDDFRFTDYPEVFYNEAGQFIGYRYMDFTSDVSTFTVTARTDSDGAVLKVYQGAGNGCVHESAINSDSKNGPVGEPIAEVRLPDTDGRYQLFTVNTTAVKSGVSSFYIVLDTAPQNSTVYVDTMRFDRKCPIASR